MINREFGNTSWVRVGGDEEKGKLVGWGNAAMVIGKDG